VRILLALCLLAFGCYRPSLDDCAVRCGAGGACPSGLSCDLAEGFCQADPSVSCSALPGDGGVPDGSLPGVLHYSAVSAGDSHACAIRRDGRMWCWGRGDEGQLGNATQSRSALPVRVGGAELTDWLAVESGANHSCGLRGAQLPGELWCWGSNNLKQVTDSFDGVQPEPVMTPGSWKAVSAGEGNTCAIDAADHLWCWGTNGDGLIGAGAADTRPPTQIGNATYVAISVDTLHACAIQTGGTLVCWGAQDEDGQLGTGDHVSHNTPTPVASGRESKWTEIATSIVFNCGIRELVAGERTLWCWGRDSGNLGTGGGGGPSKLTPVQVGSDKDWKTVAIGGRHGCGVRAESSGDHLWCWGLDNEGELGLGDRKDRFTPTRVDASSGSTWATVSAGRTFTCARHDDDSLYCFGEDAYGQLSDGHAAVEDHPRRVGDQLGWSEMAASATHTCGVRAGELYCWGSNVFGQLGFAPGDGASSVVPVKIAGTWKHVAVGAFHSCAIDDADKLSCWGLNDVGELGTNQPTNMTPHPTPAAVFGGAGTWSRVAAAQSVTCGIGAAGGTGAGKLYCWGANLYGQLGQAGGDRAAPGEVSGGNSDWTWIALGGSFNCGVHGTANHNLVCWGEDGHGQLGQGSILMNNLTTPTAVMTSDRTWTTVASGLLHSCGLQADGDLACWGANGVGMVGTGTSDDVVVPTQPLGQEKYRAVGTGFGHTCAVHEDRRLDCWGAAEFGQLGDDAARSDSTSMPTVVSNEAVWDQVVLGDEHSCGLRMDGSLWCWGRNTFGQLGTGQASTLAPARIADPPL